MENKKFEPELGQFVFGQPYKQYEASELLEAALCHIKDEPDRVMGNVKQEEYSNPFDNTGNSFVCETFEVHAYDWNFDEEREPQKFNFKYKDIEISWYKYLGRGMSVNREISNNEISDMLDDCIRAVRKLDVEI